MSDNFITVLPHEVNYGDILAGVPNAAGNPVDSILMDGNNGWWIYSSAGIIIDRRAPWTRVQVIRGQTPQSVVECRTGNDCALPGVSHSTTTSPDGITRGPCGLYVVVP